MAGGTRTRGESGRAFDLLSTLRGSRLLAAYLLAGPLVALFLATRGYGSRFLVATLANLALLALYLALLALLPARGTPRVLPVRRPHLEAGLMLALVLLVTLRGLARLGEFDLGVAGQWLARADGLVLTGCRAVLAPLALGAAEAARWQGTLADAVWLLLLPGVIFLALGYRPAELGWRLDGWWLVLPLVALSAWPTLAPVASGGAATWPTFNASRLAAGLVGGLSVEFFWRALLLTRLEALGRGTPAALVATSLLAATTLLPGRLAAEGFDLLLAAAGLVASGSALWGLTLGCLWLRARGLAPGALWHASPWEALPFTPGF